MEPTVSERMKKLVTNAVVASYSDGIDDLVAESSHSLHCKYALIKEIASLEADRDEWKKKYQDLDDHIKGCLV